MPDTMASERLALAHALAMANDFKAARMEYAKLADEHDVPPHYRSVAQLCVGRSYVLARDYPAAKAAYEKVNTISGAPSHHAIEANERIAEVERLTAGQPARDPLASRVQHPQRPETGTTLYVAIEGSDTNNGTIGSPFATLERARDEIRAIRHRGSLPAGGITVIIGDGEYIITDTFRLDTQDSGTTDAPIIYQAAPGTSPRFNAGRRITGFVPVSDESMIARLPEESRDKVLQIDLRSQGITNLGTFEPGGFASGRGFKTHPMLELYFNEQPMPISRWPNEGYVEIADLLINDGKEVHGVSGSNQGLFKYDEDRPSRWKDEKDIWLYGYWFWDWADSYEKVASIDTIKKEITLERPFHNYGYRKGQRFCAVNLLCEIDTPGEWHLDRSTGILYFYPPSDPNNAVIELSMLEGAAVELDGVSHVTFEELLWENGRGDAIIIKGGESCLVAGCTVRKFGGNGIEIDGGRSHGILSCDIHTLGRGGTIIRGGDRNTLATGDHYVENCHIHHLSRIDHTYTPAVLMDGVGNRIAHNFFHDSASSAMRVEGNDHVVEFNETYAVLLESDDQGGADMFGDPTYRGNIYRYNYWHDLGNGLGCGQAGIRLDDAISGVLIYGNVFRRCADGGFGGVQIHGGKDNYVENNLFIDCKAAVGFSPWGADLWKSYLDRIKPEEHMQPLHISRYPELAALHEHNNENCICRNVVINCGQFLLRDPGCNQLVDNHVLDQMQEFQLEADLQFSGTLAFHPIPFDEIGLYPDEYRAGSIERNYDASQNS